MIVNNPVKSDYREIRLSPESQSTSINDGERWKAATDRLKKYIRSLPEKALDTTPVGDSSFIKPDRPSHDHFSALLKEIVDDKHHPCIVCDGKSGRVITFYSRIDSDTRPANLEKGFQVEGPFEKESLVYLHYSTGPASESSIALQISCLPFEEKVRLFDATGKGDEVAVNIYRGFQLLGPGRPLKGQSTESGVTPKPR